MASIRWIGGARAIAQVRTYTFTGTWVVGETVTVTYGNLAWTYALTDATIATFLPLLEAAYNALSAADYPAHAEQTAGSTATTLTLTADTAGRPFTATVSTNSAAGLINGGASSTGTATVASAGPNDVGTAANYSGGALPGNGDTLSIDPDADDDLLYSLDALAAVTTLTVNHTGTVLTGLPSQNTDGGAGYPEYRPQYLQTAGGTVTLGSAGQSFQGTGRFKHDAGSAQATWKVYGAASGQDDGGMEACLLKGTHASNALAVLGQSEVGVAAFGGETATLLTLTATGQGAFVRCGAGVTLGTVTNAGAGVELNSAVGTKLEHTAAGGTTALNGAGNVAQLTIKGGSVAYNRGGTLNGATVLMNGAVLDFSQDTGAVLVTNPIDCYGGAAVLDPDKRANNVSSVLIVDYNGFDPGLGLGADVRVTRGVPA